MSTKHTPGPWRGNTRLIAAAPVMLEILKTTEAWLNEGLFLVNALEGDYVIELHRKIQAAIQLAEKEITHGH